MLEIDVGLANKPSKRVRMQFVGMNGYSIGSVLEVLQNQVVTVIPPKYTDPYSSVIIYEFVFANGAVSFVDSVGVETPPIQIKKLRLLGSVWQNKTASEEGRIECTIIDVGTGKKLAFLPLEEGDVASVLPGATEETETDDGVTQWVVNYKMRLI